MEEISKEEFRQLILAGIPDTLPEDKPYEPAVNHETVNNKYTGAISGGRGSTFNGLRQRYGFFAQYQRCLFVDGR